MPIPSCAQYWKERRVTGVGDTFRACPVECGAVQAHGVRTEAGRKHHALSGGKKGDSGEHSGCAISDGRLFDPGEACVAS
jgi:hypothetical protein